MTRAAVWFLLVVVAGAAAVLSFDALRSLGLLCGFAPALAWLLPVVVDAGAAAGCLAWLGRAGRGSTPTRFARTLTVVLLVASVAGNAVVHGLAAYRLAAPWWLVVAVSAVAPAVLGAVVHLAVLVAQGHSGPAESGVEGLDDPAEGEDSPADWWQEAPFADTDAARAAELIAAGAGRQAVTLGDATPGDNSIERSTGVHNGVDNNSEDRAAELMAAGAGRRRLARELGVSEHAARQLLAERTNGAVR